MSCTGWLNTATPPASMGKAAHSKSNPGRSRPRSLSQKVLPRQLLRKQDDSIIRLTQNSPPPHQLTTNTKQTTLFQFMGQRSKCGNGAMSPFHDKAISSSEVEEIAGPLSPPINCAEDQPNVSQGNSLNHLTTTQIQSLAQDCVCEIYHSEGPQNIVDDLISPPKDCKRRKALSPLPVSNNVESKHLSPDDKILIKSNHSAVVNADTKSLNAVRNLASDFSSSELKSVHSDSQSDSLPYLLTTNGSSSETKFVSSRKRHDLSSRINSTVESCSENEIQESPNLCFDSEEPGANFYNVHFRNYEKENCNHRNLKKLSRLGHCHSSFEQHGKKDYLQVQLEQKTVNREPNSIAFSQSEVEAEEDDSYLNPQRPPTIEFKNPNSQSYLTDGDSLIFLSQDAASESPSFSVVDSCEIDSTFTSDQSTNLSRSAKFRQLKRKYRDEIGTLKFTELSDEESQ